ncbi:hypothetical protein LCGC14_2079530, partial [marine sediment metagenome]
MRTRLLHILWEGIGGTERGVLDLTRKLDLEKYTITVAILSRGGSTTDDIDRKNIRVLEFGCSSFLDLRGMFSFYRFLFSNQFDIIVGHQRIFLDSAPLFALRPRPVLIFHEHDVVVPKSLKLRLFFSIFGRLYDIFIAVSEDIAANITYTDCLPARKLVVIENPVDVEGFRSVPKGSFKSSSTCQITIGTVARLVPQKDLHLFLEVARILVRWRKELQFVIVGDGPLKEELKAEAHAKDLDRRITFIGETNDVPKYINSFDLFMFTSRRESFGRTIIESLACEVPVVAVLPIAGGGRDLLRKLPGVSLVITRNPEAIAKAAIQLLED